MQHGRDIQCQRIVIRWLPCRVASASIAAASPKQVLANNLALEVFLYFAIFPNRHNYLEPQSILPGFDKMVPK
jgi:hypothetical protein